MSFSLPANASLLLAFESLPDPRKWRNKHYPLIDIVAVVIMGILCAADDFVSIHNKLQKLGFSAPCNDGMNSTGGDQRKDAKAPGRKDFIGR